ncbi:MAG: type II secretion system protein [Patescibacteria group bacterium]
MRTGITQSRGFTLTELMIVIGIIAILSTIVTANLSKGRAVARDARRQQDLSTIATALELYANRNGGSYPAPSAGLGVLAQGKLAPLTSVPVDPTGVAYVYSCTAATSTCFVQAQLEVGPPAGTDGSASCGATTTGYCKGDDGQTYFRVSVQ